jgi:transposase InsO family protein
MCLVLSVAKSGFYKWLHAKQSKRKIENQKIKKEIEMIHKDKKKAVYGSPRIYRELIDKGYSCSENRVARIMKKNNIKAKTTKRWKVTTNSDHDKQIAPNLLNQQFDILEPNKVWVSDITYIWTNEGWLYLAIVLDLYSRKIVGWAMDKKMKQDLVLTAIQQAYKNRKPSPGIIFHSDRGSQYASKKVQAYLKKKGFIQSTSTIK